MAILVPYDGSEPARKALEHAVSMESDEQIVLLRVIEMGSGILDASVELVQEALRDREDRLQEELSQEFSDRLADVDVRVETAVGEPAREIVEYAEEHDISQIVIGSHGRSGVSRILLGSVAERVVRRAPVSVTVVR